MEDDLSEGSPAPMPTEAVSRLSAVSLASILDQSVDCVKLINVDGAIQYANANGLCAMEIDDFRDIDGLAWDQLWPDEARQQIRDCYGEASAGRIGKFRAFCPTAKGTPRWWDVSVSPVSDDKGHIAGYLAVSRDITENYNSREALQIAAAELKHRLKNTYQMIASLLVMTSRGNAANEEFAEQMAIRLNAISRAQTLFADDESSCDLHQLITMLVSPFGNEASPVICDNIPHVLIEQPQGDAIALVLGELAVNSSKHGAIAFGGKILVEAAHEKNLLTIVWNERSNRAVEHHARDGGQGLKLMEQIMQARGGNFQIEWQQNGLLATMSLKSEM